jgi:hypothetical protein
MSFVLRQYAASLDGISSCLTIELSGRARRPFRAGERAIHCEHGAARLTAGPLQRVVRLHAFSQIQPLLCGPSEWDHRRLAVRPLSQSPLEARYRG